ncbi:MAG: sensor histidine kinase [Clostridia bacterium]
MKSIALKLWMAMMALVMVVLFLLWFFQIVFLEQFYTQIRISNVEKSGIEIAKVLAAGNQIEFQDKLDEFTYNNNLTAELVDLQHNILYFSGAAGMSGQMPMMRNNLRNEVYNKVFKGQIVSAPMTHPRFGSSFMIIGIPVKLDGKVQGGILINLPLASVKDTADILKVQLLYITIILLVTSVVIAFLLSRTFTRPILDITKVAMTMAAGNLTTRIHLKRRDEIGRLGETINHMGQELSKVEQLRKDLIANVSHELRTPLSLIKGYAETIKDVSGDSLEKREKHLDIIIDETNRLSDMVQEILEFSQMQAGYVDLNIQQFKINDTLERIYKKFEILGAKTGIRIVLKVEGEAFVEGDEAKIEQVLYNLLNNAFNHSAKDGEITLGFTEGQEKIRVQVADAGEGIPENQIPYIWDRFYKVDKSGNRKKSGTGLGLAIVKNILEAHRCSYGVESKEGLGTRFWFELKK